MTTYYVSGTYGTNANNGLGPDASNAANKPWATLGKALKTGTPVLPGDVIYVAPGYCWEGGTLTTIAGCSSSASPTQIIGDPLNAQGFKDGSGVRVAPGLAWVTTRTAADGLDGPITSTQPLLSLYNNNTAGLQFRSLVLECTTANTGGLFVLILTGNNNTLVEQCRLIGFTAFALGNNGAATAGLNWTMRRCVCSVSYGLLGINNNAAAATADADLNILVEDNLIFGRGTADGSGLSSSGGNLAGGVRFKGNTVVSNGQASRAIATAAGQVSTVVPVTIEGNLFIGCSIQAGTAGQIVDNGYNRFQGYLSANVNFTLAATSKVNVAPNFVLPDLVGYGLELPRNDLFGWTDAATAAQKYSAWGYTGTDLRGKTTRPWGSGASIGCWELGQKAQDTSSAVTGGGANSMKMTGAGEFSFFMPVDITTTAIGVTILFGSYGGTNYPQLIVVANPALGIMSDVVASATSAAQQVLSAAIAPTAQGVVEVRLVSRSTSVTSTTNFDLVTRTP